MRRLSLLIAALCLGLIVLPGTVYALSCETSQALDAGDACYTRVRLSSVETTLVSDGHVLVWDIDAGTPAQGGYQVRLARAGSAETLIVAGIATGSITTGDSAMIQVRGFGQIRTVGGIVTGDPLYIGASSNAVAIPVTITSAGTTALSFDDIAIALETSTTNGTTVRDAYIKIL